ncbi:MAG: hypothetical protein CMD33_03950 [Flavobacteriales bacterium]|nr:hypothetical protein [Flavobacteriales bacterium]
MNFFLGRENVSPQQSQQPQQDGIAPEQPQPTINFNEDAVFPNFNEDTVVPNFNEDTVVPNFNDGNTVVPVFSNASTATTSTVNETQPQVVQGVVKWFDDIKGYGFIRSLDTGGDVFVHMNQLRPKHVTNFVTLYTGEYVEYIPQGNGEGEGGVQRIQATEVRGIRNGTLMCDHGRISYRSYTRVGFNN